MWRSNARAKTRRWHHPCKTQPGRRKPGIRRGPGIVDKVEADYSFGMRYDEHTPAHLGSAPDAAYLAGGFQHCRTLIDNYKPYTIPVHIIESFNNSSGWVTFLAEHSPRGCFPSIS